jgi:hypothetical protein
MKATELRELIIKQIEQIPYPQDPFTLEDYATLKSWLRVQIESRISLELCERLVADPHGFAEEWKYQVIRVIDEINAEMEVNMDGSAVSVDGTEHIDMGKLRRWLQHPTPPKQTEQ